MKKIVNVVVAVLALGAAMYGAASAEPGGIGGIPKPVPSSTTPGGK
ncbi:MAG: hypothetical protein U0Z75_07790 [Deinococcaceae bacterium]